MSSKAALKLYLLGTWLTSLHDSFFTRSVLAQTDLAVMSRLVAGVSSGQFVIRGRAVFRRYLMNCWSFGNARNLENRVIFHKSINSRFARAPEELAVLVALPVQGCGLAINVFVKSSANQGVSEERQVDLTASLTEFLRLL